MIKWALPLLVMVILVGNKAEADPAACVGCHANEVAAWSDSQHSVAMALPSAETVAGDFSDSEFSDGDITVRFFRKGDSYRIATREAGEPRERTVAYTFGVYPLQQYLIDVGEGRLQAFNIAWDARSQEHGGQRWFRLDEAGHNHPGDPMHWTGIYQNWNNQCADCHSTGLKRNYDSETDGYQTQWDHVAVACESCHENAPEHAEAQSAGQSATAGVDLAAMGAWLVSEGLQPPRHRGPESSGAQVPTCGGCHSLRSRLVDSGGGQVHDELSLSRLEQPLYFSDGRVREEVFVQGSFEQSKMFAAGVVCTDCHNPHSGKLKAQGNAVCTQCHNAADFDTPEHHRHPQGSQGAQCVNCHMPESTFMKVDDRRAHSFMVPRPDVAQAAGSPDVCLACHSDKNREWSIETVRSWYPDLYQTETWHDVQQRPPEGVLEYLGTRDAPSLRRATLLEQHGAWLVREQPELIARLAANEAPVIRESAYRVLRNGSPDLARKLAAQGLSDASLAVRIATFESLSWLGVSLDTEQWRRVREEYEQFLELQSDLPSGLVLKARYLLAGNYVYKAGKALERALEKDPGYVPATILFTDILRSGGRNLEALEAIDRTLQRAGGDARLIHLRGLIHLKLQNYGKALEDLGEAAALAPGNWLFGYRYAVALFQLKQPDKARDVTRERLQRFPDNPRLQALMQQL